MIQCNRNPRIFKLHLGDNRDMSGVDGEKNVSHCECYSGWILVIYVVNSLSQSKFIDIGVQHSGYEFVLMKLLA